jgi:hypothetical protein
MNVQVIDIGGTNVKMLASEHEARRKFPSGPELTPEQMVAGCWRRRRAGPTRRSRSASLGRCCAASP